MKEKKKSFISVLSGIIKCILITCLFTVLVPMMSVRAENEMVSLSRVGTSQLGYYTDPDGYCVYCVDEMKKNANKGGEIYTKSIGGGYEMYDGIFGVGQEAISEGTLDEFTIRVLMQLAIWSKAGDDQYDVALWYYGDVAAELFNRMMNADPGDYNVTHIIYTPSDDCYQPCAGAYAVSKNEIHTHSWDAGTVTRESTYIAEGEMTYTCTGCGETRTESIPMLVCASHSWDNGKVTTEATYKTEGVKTYTCTECKETKTEKSAEKTEEKKEEKAAEPIVQGETSEEALENTSVESSDRASLSAVGIDVKLGLGYCQEDEELYDDLLKQYVSEAEEKKKKLEQFKTDKDMKNYAILVHALKSNSLTIGAKALSEKAKALEMASKADDIEFVEENHEELIREYDKTVEAIAESVN